nr:DNA-directed RNA polymerase subunit omega [Rhodopirellula sp. JC740]
MPDLERSKEKIAVLEELKEEEIVNKVGGRFKLSTLIQKRLVQLNQGSRALVNVDTHDKMSIVLQEIVQDKIFLNMDNEVEAVEDLDAIVAASEAPELDPSDL